MRATRSFRRGDEMFLIAAIAWSIGVLVAVIGTTIILITATIIAIAAGGATGCAYLVAGAVCGLFSFWVGGRIAAWAETL